MPPIARDYESPGIPGALGVFRLGGFFVRFGALEMCILPLHVLHRSCFRLRSLGEMIIGDMQVVQVRLLSPPFSSASFAALGYSGVKTSRKWPKPVDHRHVRSCIQSRQSPGE